jgi:hypothetical protein
MTLRNKDIKDIIDECDYYTDHIELQKYIRPWKTDPKFTYNKNKKCRQLNEKRLIFHPRRRQSPFDTVFSYKTNQPLQFTNFRPRSFGVTEFFDGQNRNKNLWNYKNNLTLNTTLFIILPILIIFFCKYIV